MRGFTLLKALDLFLIILSELLARFYSLVTQAVQMFAYSFMLNHLLIELHLETNGEMVIGERGKSSGQTLTTVQVQA